MKSIIFPRFLLTLAFALALFALPDGMVRAADPSAQDLISAVNGLRSGKGLPAYAIDASLSGYAQAQADYMASTGTLTHTRPDGSVPWDSGLKEDIAYGQMLTPDIAINQIWTDALHYDPMVLPDGVVGAGVARNGDSLYFSLVIRPSGANVAATLPAQPQPRQALAAVLAATPTTSITVNADGSISYLVRSGDTLTGIAAQFGVTVIELKAWNRIGDDNIVFSNTWLVIHPASTATPTPEPSTTPAPETPTPIVSITVEAPTLTPQPSATPIPTPAGFFAGVPGFFSKNVGGLIVGVALGLVLGLFFAQFGRRR